MLHYQGPATLTPDDGDRIAVDVELHTYSDGDALRGWKGTVTGDPHRLYDAFNARRMHVVLPNGSAGAAFLTHIDIGGDSAELTGSGPPPNAGE